MPNSNPLYIFLHLEKTGGTTFNGHLYHHMRFDEEFVHLGPLGNDYREKRDLPHPREKSPEEFERVRVIGGHNTNYKGREKQIIDRELRYIIFLRDPVDRILSFYNFQRSTEIDLSFKEWYKGFPENHMTSFLYNQLGVKDIKGLVEKLKAFWYIGLTETLDNDLQYLFKKLGVPTDYINRRVAGESKNSTSDLEFDTERKICPRFKITKAHRNKIAMDHALDYELYVYIKSRLRDGKLI